MNLIGAVSNYLELIDKFSKMESESEFKKYLETQVPRLVIFAGKVSPEAVWEKAMLQLIIQVSEVINSDDRIQKHLQMVFIPNFNISYAQEIIPALDLCE